MPADIKSNLADWLVTAADNEPQPADSVVNIDDNLREIQAVVRKYLATKGADIASAATVDLAAATGQYVHVTGTTTITALGTVAAGLRHLIVFDGALTFTHNATSLILPTAANITTAAGDRCEVVSLGSGNWRCLWYQRASGGALAASGSYQPLDAQLTDVAGLTPTDNGVIIGNGDNFVVESGETLRTSIGLTSATQAEMEAGTETALRSVSPLRVAQAIATLGTGTSLNTQTFTASGTWNKPAGKRFAIVQCWGGGGSGGKGAANAPAGGGGGGSFSERLLFIFDLGATETVTIGAGGAAQTTASTAGNVGGNTTFGSWLTAYGGGGGGYDATGGGGGGSGGSSGAGSTGSGATGGAAGAGLNAYKQIPPSQVIDTPAWAGYKGGDSGAAGVGYSGVLAGGSGGGGQDAAGTNVGKGGISLWGGGGGGGAANSGTPGDGGASTYGGNGSAGTIDTTASAAGSQPGGGSGGTEGGDSGAGGAGKCIVYSW